MICTHRDERIYRDDNDDDDNTPLCQSCYDRHYTNCERCGRIIHQYDAYYENGAEDSPFCYDCHTRASREKAIHDQCYKPTPIFRDDSPRYFGAELEIDTGGEDDDCALQIMGIINGNDQENLYCKHDGRLDDGLELATHPMPLEYHRI